MAESAEELDQTLSCVSSMRCVSGLKMNPIAGAAQCRGPSRVCTGISVSGITSPAPLLHIHLSDSLKFPLFCQLDMEPNKCFSFLLQDLKDFRFLLLSLPASWPSASLVWKLFAGGIGLELDSTAATLVG